MAAEQRFRDFGHGAAGLRGIPRWQRWLMTAFEDHPFAEGNEHELHRGPHD